MAPTACLGVGTVIASGTLPSRSNENKRRESKQVRPAPSYPERNDARQRGIEATTSEVTGITGKLCDPRCTRNQVPHRKT